MIGAMIKEYISGLGLKFGAVAERAGIPFNTFSAMLNGKRKITVEEFFSICQALGVEPNTFYQKTA